MRSKIALGLAFIFVAVAASMFLGSAVEADVQGKSAHAQVASPD